MLRAADLVTIVATSLVLTSGVMWTRAVSAGPDTADHATRALIPVAPQFASTAERTVRVVHPGYVRRGTQQLGTARSAEPQRWVDPYRIRTIVER